MNRMVLVAEVVSVAIMDGNLKRTDYLILLTQIQMQRNPLDIYAGKHNFYIFFTEHLICFTCALKLPCAFFFFFYKPNCSFIYPIYLSKERLVIVDFLSAQICHQQPC